MPLTLARIAELRRGTSAFKPSAEMTELLDAAEAWALVEAEARERYRFGDRPVRWLWVDGRVTFTFSRLLGAGYPTILEAVLAALARVEEEAKRGE